jgi:FXSXX-COOH protein
VGETPGLRSDLVDVTGIDLDELLELPDSVLTESLRRILRDSGKEIAGAPAHGGDLDIYRRLWLRRRRDGIYPTQEEFYTVAPAQALDKQLDSFEEAWTAHTDAPLARLERSVDTAIARVQQTLIDSRRRSTAA